MKLRQVKAKISRGREFSILVLTGRYLRDLTELPVGRAERKGTESPQRPQWTGVMSYRSKDQDSPEATLDRVYAEQDCGGMTEYARSPLCRGNKKDRHVRALFARMSVGET